MKDKILYYLHRFGMIIPFVLSVICLLSGAKTASYIFAGIFAAYLVYWIVRVIITVVKWDKMFDKERKEGKVIATDKNPDVKK